MIGKTLGNYRISQRLAAGGMGEVYIGEHTLIGRKAAIKVLLPHVSQRPQIVDRFFQEAKATAAIGHPGIVEIYDFGFHTDGRAYLVMEFLDGEVLSACIKRERRLPLDRAVAIVRRIAAALGAAHDKGIVHRDLKPDNIFLIPAPDSAGGERIKLLDFGIAKLKDSEQSALKTGTGVVMGTPAYMAPEQCRGAGRVDHRADMYSLGCIFFELACGRRPFVGVGAGELIGMHQFREPPRPSSIWPEIDAGAEALILALLEKQPEDRVQDTAELRARLDELVPSHTITGIATPLPGSLRPVMPEVARGSQSMVPQPDVALPAEVARGSQPVVARLDMVPPRPRTSQPIPRPGTVQPAAPTGTSQPIPRSGTVQPAAPYAYSPVEPSAGGSGLIPMHGHDAHGSVTTLHGASVERGNAELVSDPRRWYVIAGVAAVLIGIAVGGLLMTRGKSSGAGKMAAAATLAADEGAADERAADKPVAAVSAEPTLAAEADEALAAEAQPEEEAQPDEAEADMDPPDMPAFEMDVPPDGAAEISVTFSSEPEGAAVKLRGKREVLCTTPCTRTVPGSQGSQEFIIAKSGYSSQRVKIDGAKGGEGHVTLQKRPKKTKTTELPDELPL